MLCTNGAFITLFYFFSKLVRVVGVGGEGMGRMRGFFVAKAKKKAKGQKGLITLHITLPESQSKKLVSCCTLSSLCDVYAYDISEEGARAEGGKMHVSLLPLEEFLCRRTAADANWIFFFLSIPRKCLVGENSPLSF